MKNIQSENWKFLTSHCWQNIFLCTGFFSASSYLAKIQRSAHYIHHVQLIILAISAGEEEAWARPGRSISPSIACFFQSQLSISIFNKIRACIALHSSPATTCTTTLTPTQRLTISTALCYCFCSSCLCLAWLWQEWTATAVVDVVALDKLQKIATFNCKAGRKCSSDSFCQRI